ncbi:MAG: 2-isopropylmalate synthase [Candidatus Omnitrophota bacterium]
MRKRIFIHDTTLRDGEQSPGASLQKNEKLEIALGLQRLGVDVIEAGFPIASHDDLEAVKLVSKRIKNAGVCALARALKKDIDVAYEAVRPAKAGRIHIFLATSKIHMQYKLKKAEDEILRQAVSAVRYASGYISDIQFSPEDASRTEADFLFKVIEAVIDAGARTVNIPDTVGYSVPHEYGQLIYNITRRVRNINKAVISVHCHNDLGLSVANSLSAVKNGAKQVECTINGIGERAGNASLEEIVMAMNTRRDFFHAMTNIKTKYLYETSRMVSRLTGIIVQPNKAIVGSNAFAHEAGIHQDGILKKRCTYEIIQPKDVGFGETKLVLGKHSGKHALSVRLKKIGFDLNGAELERAFDRFKSLADKKKNIYDEDLKAIVEDEMLSADEVFKLVHFYAKGGTARAPKSTVCLEYKNRQYKADASGDGPIDACYKAIDMITGLKGRLIDYSIRSATSGKDALGEASIKVSVKDRVVTGRGTSTDIIEASVKAYLNAMDKIPWAHSSRLKGCQ